MSLTNLKNLANLAQTAKQTKPVNNENQVLKLDVKKVQPKPDQVRKSFVGIEELAESLKQEGQIQPIIVSPINVKGIYQIQKGERRWRACVEAGLTTIDAIVNQKEQTSLEATAGELIENIQRDDLEPLEVAQALQQFVDEGWKRKDIAQRIGKKPAFVSSHLGLLKLPEPVLALYQANVTHDPETLNNLRQLHDLDAECCEQLCKNATEQGITRSFSREALNQLKKPKSQPQTISTKEQEKPLASNPDQTWTNVKAAQMQLKISHVKFSQQGEILKNRIDHDENYVWVRWESGEIERVLVSNISLVGVGNK